MQTAIVITPIRIMILLIGNCIAPSVAVSEAPSPSELLEFDDPVGMELWIGIVNLDEVAPNLVDEVAPNLVDESPLLVSDAHVKLGTVCPAEWQPWA